MTVTAVVFHKGALAHYLISLDNKGTIIADLRRYDGKRENEPPIRITFNRKGKIETDQPECPALIGDLREVIKSKFQENPDKMLVSEMENIPHNEMPNGD